ncbi:MAG: glycosyltransferase [Candidatus Margulisiibacteriota bacterium]
MKILFYSDSKWYGGAEKYLEDLIEAAALANEVIFVHAEPVVVKRTFPKNVRLVNFKIAHPFDLPGYFRLKKLFSAERPDQIHFNLHVPFSCQYGILAASRLFRRSQLSASVLYVLKMGSKFPLVGRFRMQVARWLLGRMAKLICVSERSRSELIENYNLKNEVVTKYLGVELPVIDPEIAAEIKRRWSLEGKRIVGSVSRLVNDKGLEELIKAFAALAPRFPAAVLMIVGAGYLEAKLKAAAAELQIADRVIFPGFVADPAPYLSLFDLFVLFSKHESFPLSVLEAMAQAKPVIATNTGGTPEMVDDSTGILLAPDDLNGLIAAIAALLDDPAKGRAMGEKGLARVKKEFLKAENTRRTIAAIIEVKKAVK